MRQSFALLAVVFVVFACGDDGSSAVDSGTTPDALVNEVDAMSVSDASTGNVPRLEAASCRFSVPGNLGSEGTEYECDDLIVYENRAAPTGTIKVHYIRFFSSAASNNGTIYLDGGPGGNGNNILAYIGFIGTDFLNGLMVDGDFLVIAQRGTSLSDPALLCGDPGCSDMPGVDVPSYNTAYNADDVDDLRAALGLDKLNLYGISYGSRLGLEVMRRHGDNLRSSVIGGLVPSQIIWPAHIPASFYSALTALNASCVDHGACNTAFGDLETKFVSAFNTLNDSPVSYDFQGDTITVDGWTLAYVLFQILYAKSTYPWLPMLISDLAESRTDRVGDFLGNMLTNFGGGSDISTGLYYSVVCNELFNPPDNTAFDTANASVPADIRDIFSYNWWGILDTCSNYPLGTPRPELSQPVVSNVRTLVSSGSMDPITPPSFGDIAAANLTNAEVVVFANSGHGATLQSTCGQTTFLNFLANPDATPDTTCAPTVTTDYILPQMMPFFTTPLHLARIRLELAHAPPLPFFLR